MALFTLLLLAAAGPLLANPVLQENYTPLTEIEFVELNINLPVSDGNAATSKVTDKEVKIIGGSTASSGQFPYIASLRTAANVHFCGATIVSSFYLISVAQCTYGLSATDIIIVVGTNILDSGGTTYSASRIINHERYDFYTLENDISLIRTSSSILIGGLVSTIPINSADIGGGIPAVLSGWGQVTYPGDMSKDLQFLNVSTLTNEDCLSYYDPAELYDEHICAFAGAGHGMCLGDYGGPLVVNNVLIGVVSWMMPCAIGYPDVYTRISSYIEWIQSNAT